MSSYAVVEIGGSQAVDHQVPARKLVYLMLLLAVADQATEVQLEPSLTDEGWNVRYLVGGICYEMVPVPLEIPISRTIRRMARLGRTDGLLRRFVPWAK